MPRFFYVWELTILWERAMPAISFQKCLAIAGMARSHNKVGPLQQGVYLILISYF
jgi:hypothetical protein